MCYNPYSYKTQLKFLQGRIAQEMDLYLESKSENSKVSYFVVDRSIYEDTSVFAKSQALNGLMSEEEYKKYLGFFDVNKEKIRLPSLIIYLKMEPRKLFERIQKRGRDMEKDVSEEYLRSLQHLYDSYIKEMESLGVKILEINTETRDDYPLVLEQISKLSPTNNAYYA